MLSVIVEEIKRIIIVSFTLLIIRNTVRRISRHGDGINGYKGTKSWGKNKEERKVKLRWSENSK